MPLAPRSRRLEGIGTSQQPAYQLGGRYPKWRCSGDGRYVWSLFVALWLVLSVGACALEPPLPDSVQAAQGEQPPSVVPLTPNSKAITTSLQDINEDTEIVLQIEEKTYWRALLSVANVEVKLSAPRGNDRVVFHEGLSVSLHANGAAGNDVFLSGNITDDGTQYVITGKLLAHFPCCIVCTLTLQTSAAP